MKREDYVATVKKYLKCLHEAYKQLSATTTPPVSMPRARKFWFTPRHCYPYFENEQPCFDRVAVGKSCDWFYEQGNKGLAEDICKACNWQPRKILRAVRRIAAAAEWCRKRAEGRKRHAEEILRQQSRWERELRNQRTLDVMARLGGQA